jgi:CRISPR-associated protein Cmr1
LPLTFRYNSLEGKQTTFQGKEHDRSASPLFIRIVEINGKCYPFFALLDAPLLALDEKIKEQNEKDPTWPQPSRAILNEFCQKELLLKAIKEVRWSAIPPP